MKEKLEHCHFRFFDPINLLETWEETRWSDGAGNERQNFTGTLGLVLQLAKKQRLSEDTLQ